MQTFEYGAMSSSFTIKAENKLTAYVAMCLHYRHSAHLVALYAPEEIKADTWLCFDGKISQRLDEIFGGPGKFDEYAAENQQLIRDAYLTIKQLV